MKKCPYCAEQIRDEAIVCRYCGRDLPKEVIEESPKTQSKSKQASIWKISTIVSAGITILLAIGDFSTIQYDNPLAFRATTQHFYITLLFSFLIFWLITAVVVWLWKRGGVILMLLIGAVIFLGWLFFWWIPQWEGNNNVAPTISTPQPIATSQPIATATFLTEFNWNLLPTPSSTCWPATSNLTMFLGKTICVTGTVVRIGNYTIAQEYGQNVYGRRLFFSDSQNSFFLEYYEGDFSKPGDCLVVVGQLKEDSNKTSFMDEFQSRFCSP